MSAGHLTHWLLALRESDHARGVVAAIARSSDRQMAAHAATHPTLVRKLSTTPEHLRIPALVALSYIARARDTRHDPTISVGRALTTLDAASPADAVAAAIGLDQQGAARILGGLLTRTPACNLVAFAELMTSWDETPVAQRARLLVDFHAAAAHGEVAPARPRKTP